MKNERLPVVVIEVDESEEITVAVRAEDLLEGDTADPWRHPIAIALRRQDDVDDARVTKKETLVRRGKQRDVLWPTPPTRRTHSGVPLAGAISREGGRRGWRPHGLRPECPRQFPASGYLRG
jgi:hypothetical protein